jgi:spore germination protein GerM
VTSHSLRISVAVAACICTLAGCGIGVDSEPRPVDPGLIEPDPLALDPGADGDGVSTVFMVSADGPDGTPVLEPVGRTSDRTPLAVLAALFSGPTAAEVSARVRTDIPIGLPLRSVAVRNGTMVVDVGQRLQELAGETLIRALAQITLTAMAIEGIRAVQVTVEGVPQQWPAGNGELHSDPLTRYDFPGLVPSEQPPFPAIPSRPLEVPTALPGTGTT